MDVPEYLVQRSLPVKSMENIWAIADLTMIKFYYLLQVGEYMAKGYGQVVLDTTQTQPFKIKDISFFGTMSTRGLYHISNTACNFEIMHTTCATLKLDNQKNSWKGIYINHEHNGNDIYCAVWTLGCCYLHIQQHTTDTTTPLYAYFKDKTINFVMNQDIQDMVKLAATVLDYPATQDTPISLINTHSLHIGGACALMLTGYSHTQIQKWVVGTGQVLRNMFGKIFPIMLKACQKR